MKPTRLALLLLAVIGAGCAGRPAALSGPMSALPDCFDANFEPARGLFTMRNAVDLPVNQQCLLTVWPHGGDATASRLTAGSYSAHLANGGGGGAGGTAQGTGGAGGGGGGGGAGAREVQATLNLAAGVYRLTIGAGGPGGDPCTPAPYRLGGGPGWAGSPSNIVRIATGELVMGVPGADTYARPSRARNDRLGPYRDGRGGSGPGQTSGGPGGYAWIEGGTGAGGGGGATRLGAGGGGGGQTPDHRDLAPQRGSLGGGGGGGEGHSQGCDPGARGGDGYIALRPFRPGALADGSAR